VFTNVVVPVTVKLPVNVAFTALTSPDALKLTALALPFVSSITIPVVEALPICNPVNYLM
jgi:hypothetical protein